MTIAIQPKNIEALHELANKFQDASISDATRRAYRSDWASFLSFCHFHKIGSLPANIETIKAYLTELAEGGKSVSTISRALTSINKAHELSGHGSIRHPPVLATLKGIRRTIGKPQSKVSAIMFDDLIKLSRTTRATLLGYRDRAILMLGWTSALRRSELVSLNIGDLEFSEQGLIVTICRSKTDQEGKGRQIGIPSALKGVCPVLSVKSWIDRLYEKDRVNDSPLFQAIGNGGHRFWYDKLRGRLSPRMVSAIVKKYANLAGLNGNYASHSLRRGLATEAGARKVEERTIARHTGHASMSVLREYIDAGSIWIDNPLIAIYEPSSSPIPGLD